MGTWNHRIIRKVFPEHDTVTFEIHDVYYSDQGVIDSWTEEPVSPSGESEAELREDIRHFLQAFRLPILEEQKKNEKAILIEDTDDNRINSGHYFEFMDRSSVALDYVYQFVGSHPLLKKENRLKEAYLKAEKELANLYQIAGQIEDEQSKK